MKTEQDGGSIPPASTLIGAPMENGLYKITKKVKHGKNVFGTIKMVFYDNYRRDKVGMYILKLSRFSHLLIRFPGLRKIVDKIVSEFPDNAFNRFVWTFTKNALNDRVHAGAPLSFFFKYFFFHRGKQVR